MRTILKNGKFYIEKDVFREAILVEDGLIKEVGSNAEISKYESDHLVDMKGRTVLPGINDSHLHLTWTGVSMTSCNLTTATSIDDVIRLGREFLEDNPDIVALPGRGWNQDYFEADGKRLIDRHDLDKISTEIPIVFTRVCGHMATGNTKALQVLGVDENTRVSGGVIELDSNGKPNGIFTENAISLLSSAIPSKTDEDIRDEILKAAEYAISMGLTSVQSADAGGEDFQRVFDIIHDIYDEKKTKLRYGHQFNFQEIEHFKSYIETEYKNGHYDEKFLSKGALKIFMDGSLGARTALMIEDYADAPGVRGVEVLSNDELEDLCRLASENGIRVVTHAIGDAAVESLIDAYESTMENGENSLRHGIVHCQITSMEQLERIADLNIPVLYQPIFLDYDINIMEDRVGKELSKTSYAFNSLYKLGGPISLGTDSPVEDLNPWNNIYCAVTRMGLDEKPEGGYNPNEKMDITDAIDAYTIGSAYNEFKEDFKGRIKPGFVADLVVLDRDIFTIDPVEIKDINVVKTMIDGEFVYEM